MDTIQTQHTDQFTPLLIVSSDCDFPAFAKMHGINYKPVMGFYHGIIEESYVVNQENGPKIMAEGLLRGQETVLLLTPQPAVFNGLREAWLAPVDASGMVLDTIPDPEFIGLWHKVSCREALHCDAWTCYPEANAWYVARMPDTPTCDNLSQ